MVQEIAEKAFAITTVLLGVEDVRVPNFVSVERWNQCSFWFQPAKGEVAEVVQLRCSQTFT
jgi:hypothetical protein